MTPRPIRSQLYLPILRFGITDEDWAGVILASLLGYTVPFLLGLKLYGLPVELISWIVLMGLSIATLNLTRRKNRPGWVKHALQARLKGTAQRRWLPADGR
ncbi:MAG: hypothetical protein ACKV2V_09730 [Blastocatellia bacterium]